VELDFVISFGEVGDTNDVDNVEDDEYRSCAKHSAARSSNPPLPPLVESPPSPVASDDDRSFIV
jgi:hypothetical protein